MLAADRRPYLTTSEDVAFQFFGSPTVMHATGKATDERFCLMEHVAMPPGLASPYHTHLNEDEAFYVLDGHVRFVCDGRWLDAGPGTWVYGPRGIPHGFRVMGERPARMLLMCAPAGFEKFVLELCSPLDAVPGPPEMATLIATAGRFNVNILGPLPDNPDTPARAEDAPLPARGRSLRSAVDETRTRHIAAVNAGDAHAATALFAPNGVLLPPDQPALESTAAIDAWFTRVFGDFRIQDFALEPGSFDERGEIAVEHGLWSATFTPMDGSAGMRAGGTYLTVYARGADGTVRIAHDTFNGMPGQA